MSFLSDGFLFGLIAAGGPLLIHLLNRTRRRTIQWAAMDFLRDAIRRNRRILRLRDIILLLLRTVAVLLFVLAMARPFWAAGEDDDVGDQAMHAVIVLDNSLSMGYRQLDKTLLDLAKDKTKAFIKRLPKGSEISVIPLCAGSSWDTRDVYSTKEDALDAVDRLEVVDRSASLLDGFAEAQRACRQASDIPTKRVVFVGDLQRGSWEFDGLESYIPGIEDVQIVQVSPPARENTWVESFKLLRDVADAESTAVFRAVIRHEGPRRDGVRVALKIGRDSNVLDTEHVRRVDLYPGHSLQVDFRHKFDDHGSSAQPRFVPVRVELAPDHLPQDDFRTLIAPVLATVPIVFIDQYGPAERPRENLYGETARLRRLMASSALRDEPVPGRRRLVRVVHRTIDTVKQEDLEDARLVVLGGIKEPTPKAVELLRQYLQQGGQMLLAAGAEFDPTAWTRLAWRDGAGILPAPLLGDKIGRLPRPGEIDAPSFHLDTESIIGEMLYLDTTPEERKEIFETPLVFQAVAVDLPAARKAVETAERRRIETRRAWLSEYEANERRWTEMDRRGQLTQSDRARRARALRKFQSLNPNWLNWRNPLARNTDEMSLDELVQATQPRVIGQYDNGHAFVVQRNIGKGTVLLMTTGLWPSWNTLALENSVLVLDRMVRGMLLRSLPERTFGPERQIVIPVDEVDQMVDFRLQAPTQEVAQTKSVEALGGRSYGLVLRSVQQRGLYRIQRMGGEGGGASALDVVNLAVNGDPAESELASLPTTELPTRIATASLRLVEGNDPIQLTGKTYIGPDFWKVLMSLSLGCLLLEMLILGTWRRKSKGRASA